ncbi:MAG TPA: hypothetical protein EYP57_03530 [Thermodesulfobacteriaceae bacterium]|nr:hypothetical protein [Thermodesulfobacteriaceae bacterium]
MENKQNPLQEPCVHDQEGLNVQEPPGENAPVMEQGPLGQPAGNPGPVPPDAGAAGPSAVPEMTHQAQQPGSTGTTAQSPSGPQTVQGGGAEGGPYSGQDAAVGSLGMEQQGQSAQPDQFYQQPQGSQPGDYRMDPQAYYAAWQQAVWQQQMAAAQAAAMNQNPSFAGGKSSHSGYNSGFQGDPGASPHHLKHDEHKYGQMVQIAQRFLNGEADMQDVMNGVSLLEQEGNQFWRGIIAGGLVAMLVSSDTVRDSIGKLFSPEKREE